MSNAPISREQSGNLDVVSGPHASHAAAKLRESAGETLVEALVAVLIIVLALTLFPTAVSAAANVAAAAEDTAGTCPIDRSPENLLGGTHSSYIAFRTASRSAVTGAYSVNTANMNWGYNANATNPATSSYVTTYTGNGSYLTSTTQHTTTQSQINVNCYVNSAEGGSSSQEYYFYDAVGVN